MKLNTYLDATFLKTPQDSGFTIEETQQQVVKLVQEAVEHDFKLVMIRSEFVSLAKQMILNANSKVLVGTVIDFPLGNGGLEIKLNEAQNAINLGADDLDFVVDYEAYKKGEIESVSNEILLCTELGLKNNKVVKWIIEVAALTESQIEQLTTLIKEIVVSNFKEIDFEKVFVKSSTGFYITQDNKPNGATIPTIKLMLKNAFPLLVKAAGGVRTQNEAIEMINLGVKRIGTSSQLAIIKGSDSNTKY